MIQESSQPTHTADREIVVQRTFDAPRELVFEAWTSIEHLSKWWGPNGFSTTTHEFSFKVGGHWKFIMHGPDGTDYPNWIRFDEIVRPERIAYTHQGKSEDEPTCFKACITFRSEGDKTHVTLRSIFRTAAARDLVVKEYGALNGAMEHLGRLSAHLAERTGKKRLQISRVFDAPVALVFRAWSSGEHLAKWFAPDCYEMIPIDIDVRPGGSFTFAFRGADKEHGEHRCEGSFIEVVQNRRLVYESIVAGVRVLTIVRFEAEGSKTRLDVEQIYAEDAPFLTGAPIGWSQTLDHLATFVRTS
jgi:uncharacterized protein YndB with AHSA1/START domain